MHPYKMIRKYQTQYFQCQKYKLMLFQLSIMLLIEISSVQKAMHHREMQSWALQTDILEYVLF